MKYLSLGMLICTLATLAFFPYSGVHDEIWPPYGPQLNLHAHFALGMSLVLAGLVLIWLMIADEYWNKDS